MHAPCHVRHARQIISLKRCRVLSLQAMPHAACPPRVELAARRSRSQSRSKTVVELLGQRGIADAQRDLVVGLEGAVVEVARADRAPLAVDGHHLLVQQARLVLEDADAARQQLLEVAVRSMLHDRHVRRVGRRHHDAHVDAALRPLARTPRSLRLRAGNRGSGCGCVLARHAHHEVMQDLDRRRRSLGLEAGDVNVHACPRAASREKRRRRRTARRYPPPSSR